MSKCKGDSDPPIVSFSRVFVRPVHPLAQRAEVALVPLRPLLFPCRPLLLLALLVSGQDDEEGWNSSNYQHCSPVGQGEWTQAGR